MKDDLTPGQQERSPAGNENDVDGNVSGNVKNVNTFKKNKTLTFNGKEIINYELYLLGSYLIGAPIGPGIAENVFYTKRHQVIFSVIRELKAQGIEVNILILNNELKRRGKLDDAGGPAYIASLTDSAASGANVSFYEREVLDAHQGRSLFEAAVKVQDALKRGETPEAVQKIWEAAKTMIAKCGNSDSGIFFKDLLKKEFPPDNFLVENLIATGLTMITGSSKIGKSWTALQLATALDHGGYFLGILKAQKCDVLYLALEDTERRIQKRLKKQGINTFSGSRLETKRMTPAALRDFLVANPQIRVVIIDTFQKMMGLDDLNDYAKTVNGMSALKAIADDLSIAVVVIHHNRKSCDQDIDHMESALGSTGLNATADCTITMRRKRGCPVANLQVSGRDVEDATYTLQWDKDICSWSITEQGALMPTVTEAQQQIIDLLESEDREWSVGEIAKALGKGKSTVSEQARKLFDMKFIDCPSFGNYRVKTPFGRSVPLKETEQPNAELLMDLGERAAPAAVEGELEIW